MVKHLIILMFICFTSVYILFSQGEIDDQKTISYRNERTFRIGLNTNGYGADYRYAKRLNYTEKRLYEAHITFIKHPKEEKISSSPSGYGPKFVYGKLNSLTSLKFGYGYQKELFPKFDKGGISIKYFYSFGPTIGIEKPIYYQIENQITGEVFYERFDVTRSDQDYQDQMPFYYHLFEFKLVPGIFAQFGYHFEYSKVDAVIHAIEVGAGAELFARKILIMDETKNRQLYLYLFARYRFGKIIDPLDKRRKEEYKKYLREY